MVGRFIKFLNWFTRLLFDYHWYTSKYPLRRAESRLHNSKKDGVSRTCCRSEEQNHDNVGNHQEEKG